MNGKPITWLGSSLAELRAFPEDARRRAGYESHQVQRGLTPSDWKPMSRVGSGVFEIQVRIGLEHRIFYVTKFGEAVYVLHAFEKKSRKTSKRDIDRGRARYAEWLRLPREGRQRPNR